MRNLRQVAALVALAGLACSSAAAPDPPSMLLVTNATCASGSCDPLDVLAFPSNQPLTPGGYWSLDLGLITTPQACFTIPTSAKFLIVAVNPDSSRDTTTITWTSSIPVSLGAIPPSGNRIMAGPSTSAFVPSSSPGWTVTFPNGSAASPNTACSTTD